MADRVREEDDAINEENALLEERIHHLREDLNRAEAAINAARVKQDQTEQNCDFRLNIAEGASPRWNTSSTTPGTNCGLSHSSCSLTKTRYADFHSPPPPHPAKKSTLHA